MVTIRMRSCPNTRALGTGIGFASVILAVGLMGCVTAGKNFVRPTSSTCLLGKTTKAEILSRYGTPSSTGQFTTNGKLVDSVHYYYAIRDLDRWTYKKHGWFYFIEDRLIGYSVANGLPGEQVDFDAKKAASVKKGVTTKRQVLADFGEPAASAMYPMTPEKTSEPGDTFIRYEYLRIHGSGAYQRKDFSVLFDSNDIAKDPSLDVSQTETPPAQKPETESGGYHLNDSAR